MPENKPEALLYYCEVCFDVPLNQSFTYIYRPKPFVEAKSGKGKRAGKKSPNRAAKKQVDQSFELGVRQASEVQAETGVELLPQLGMRMRAQFGRSVKEGWLISAATEQPDSLVEALRAGKLQLEHLKELEIASPQPLFGVKELSLARWLALYYICSLGEALNCILPTSKKEKEPLLFDSLADSVSNRDLLARPAILSAEQELAVNTICRSLKEPGEAKPGSSCSSGKEPFFYLFGPTGSGKTEVFLQCIEQALKQGKGVIYLVPEISLCYQLQGQLQERFQEPVALLHSHLSADMRLGYWRSLQEGNCRIVLGARSAVFAPMEKLGLIILDEEHEQSYKAGDTPRYHARQVAMWRCRNHKGLLLMGSATPSVEAMHASAYLMRVEAETATQAGTGLEAQDNVNWEVKAKVQSEPKLAEIQAQKPTEQNASTVEKTKLPDFLPDFMKEALCLGGEPSGQQVAVGQYGDEAQAQETRRAAGKTSIQLLRLSQRLAGGSFPTVEILDLRHSRTMISKQLVREIEDVSRRGDQAILFLNRRGYSPIVECFACGKAQECRYCSVALTYHKNSQRLKCHHCGFSQVMITTCNYCHKAELEFVGFGTEQIEEELQQYFGHLRIARLDTDVARKKGQSQKILQELHNGKIDLLVGTQMVAKGLNFERVKLVGVILADTSLNMPDFRAAERSFSLLLQVAGRAGRFSKDGKVLIQTYQPQNEVVKRAAAMDWQSFYVTELQLRQLTHYPPFSRLIRLVFRGKDMAKVQKEARQWHSDLQQMLREAQAGHISQAADAADKQEVFMQLFAPCECPYFRIANKYRYHMLLRSSIQYFALLHSCVKSHFWQTKRNAQVYVEIDVDPCTMM